MELERVVRNDGYKTVDSFIDAHMRQDQLYPWTIVDLVHYLGVDHGLYCSYSNLRAVIQPSLKRLGIRLGLPRKHDKGFKRKAVKADWDKRAHGLGYANFKNALTQMRRNGLTYGKIADLFGCSLSGLYDRRKAMGFRDSKIRLGD